VFTARYERLVRKLLVDCLDEVAIDREFMGKHAGEPDEIRVLGDAIQNLLGRQPMQDVVVMMRDVLLNGFSDGIYQYDLVALLLEICSDVCQSQRRSIQ
jgi:hypothetical protein